MALKPFRAAPLPFLPSCWNTGCCFTTRNFPKGILQREKQVRSHPRSCHSSGIHLPAADGFGGPSRGDALVPTPGSTNSARAKWICWQGKGEPQSLSQLGKPGFPQSPLLQRAKGTFAPFQELQELELGWSPGGAALAQTAR